RIPLDAEEEESSGLIREDADYFYHQVRAGETLYSLSQKYDKKMSLIMETNSLSDQQLEVGVVLRIPKKEEEDEEKAPMVDGDGEYFLHRVESGDTFYSYKRRFGVTKEQLLQLNPELNDGLLAGLTIKIPSKEIPQVKVKPRDADKFIDHKVKPGETFYSLSRKFDIGIMAIKSLNPELKNRGLKAGEIIYIPNIKEKYELADTLKSEDAKPLTLTEETDIELPEAYFEVEEDTFEVYTDKFNILEDDTFRISMFLPLFYDKNDTFNLELRDEEEMAKLDSLKDVDPEILEAYFEIRYDEESLQADTIMTDSLVAKSQKSLMPHTKYFMNFYQGFLLGLDSMYNAGVKIRLDLYDSQYDREVVDSLLLSKDFINADLIVGPVDVSLQKHISEFSNKNQIPMVSPFSSNSLFLEENPFYYQVSPSKDYVLRKTSDFIGDAFYDKNFIVMTLGEIEQLSESNLVDLVREKFFTSGVYNNVGEVLFTQVDFTEGGHLGYWQVKKTLKPDMENVIFIPASENRDVREALLSRAINSLYVLSEEFDITLVGVSDYPNFRSINTEYFHKLKLHYLTPRYVDYTSPLVNEFIAGYRGHFYDEPDEYSFRGYDIALFFTGAYAYLGNNFSDKISAYRTRLTQSDFNFQRVSEMSGYMNHTLYIMNYTKGYDVNMLYKITEGRMIVNE
ncbi:MAG: LysM peptidoglycan-binding domain-containing protein, partial [Prolixibacteraceae bacterium]|nr:LysM peptidoglycan-binding domain-containing protein [Prolixibacteraceae bacterium]